ncbi:protein-disulfide reductase DsbD domain-containing protein [Dongshaea marina]|uniref:protein-disulfide reductase DsbD domain-containing protein n=1 Tax=Dongshaea marina TaxID=2047966 RepID=UPI000D3E7586|nr:protein-disulfide reductase DsbD domain-containing protein [Dongshaea marina]
MKFLIYLIISLSALLAPLSSWGAAPSAADSLLSSLQPRSFLSPEQAFGVQLIKQGEGYGLSFRAAPSYYLYQQDISAFTQDGQSVLSGGGSPDPELKQDPNFGSVLIYPHGVTYRLADGASGQPIRIHYRGCSDQGLCYPPQQVQLKVPEFSGKPTHSAHPLIAATQPSNTSKKLSDNTVPPAVTLFLIQLAKPCKRPSVVTTYG